MATVEVIENFELPGEGERKLVERVRYRHECDCGRPATKRHSYLLPNARREPASSAYGRDDCSWCSDHETFTCDGCKQPRVDGYEWCSTFSVTPENTRFAHMLLYWHERTVPTQQVSA